MLNKVYTMVKLEVPPSKANPILAGPDDAALVLFGTLIFAAIVCIVLMIYNAITKRSRKLTAQQQEKRAHVVAARHKHLSEHE